MADRFRAEGVDCRRRSKDCRAREESGELRTELASEARERVVKEIVSELVEWLDGITPVKVLGDIERIVAEHDGPSQHMKKPEELKGGRLNLCKHESKYVEFSVYWSPEWQDLSYFLKPVRGYGLVEEVVGKGWQDMIFPWFYGLKTE